MVWAESTVQYVPSSLFATGTCKTAEHLSYTQFNHHGPYTISSDWYYMCSGPSVYIWSIKCVSKKVPPLQFHYISLSSQGRATKTALPCICWQISLPAVGETLMSTWWDCTPHPPLWTNKIRVKMKSIITADIFISGLPYLITNFFQGFLEEFILWASLSLLLRICCLVMYTLLPEGRSCFIAVSLIVAHSLLPCLVLCLLK